MHHRRQRKKCCRQVYPGCNGCKSWTRINDPIQVVASTFISHSAMILCVSPSGFTADRRLTLFCLIFLLYWLFFFHQFFFSFLFFLLLLLLLLLLCRQRAARFNETGWWRQNLSCSPKFNCVWPAFWLLLQLQTLITWRWSAIIKWGYE